MAGPSAMPSVACRSRPSMASPASVRAEPRAALRQHPLRQLRLELDRRPRLTPPRGPGAGPAGRREGRLAPGPCSGERPRRSRPARTPRAPGRRAGQTASRSRPETRSRSSAARVAPLPTLAEERGPGQPLVARAQRRRPCRARRASARSRRGPPGHPRRRAPATPAAPWPGCRSRAAAGRLATAGPGPACPGPRCRRAPPRPTRHRRHGSTMAAHVTGSMAKSSLRRDAHGAQQAQSVLVEAPAGVAHGAHEAGPQVALAIRGVHAVGRPMAGPRRPQAMALMVRSRRARSS